jgi:alkylation response protein AidB-like acyl-CoA dehydrogenase
VGPARCALEALNERPLVDLDLTSEQELLRDTVRGVCSRYAPLASVRALEDDPVGYSPEFWGQLGQLGLIGMIMPEAYGGSEMSMFDAALVYSELGRALAPSPHFASSIVCATAIALAGTAEQKQQWLVPMSAGEAIIVPAWLEPGGGFGPKGITLQAQASDGGWRLTGTKRHVPYASAATRLLVLANSPAGILLALVDPAAEGVTLSQQMTVASDTQYRVEFAGVEVAPDAVLGSVGSGWDIWDEVMHDAIILAAAQATGGARLALEITVQYSKDRQQFDKPLGAFQALAHYLADGVAAVDGAETLVWEAAWARSTGRSIDRLAPMAKLFACRTFRDVTAVGQQIFGGVGFTVDYDIQLYFRRAKQLEMSWWDTRYLEDLVATDILDRIGA